MLKWLLLIISASTGLGIPINDESFKRDQDFSKSEDQKIYRLPGEVYPKSYDLRMVPDLEQSTFRGQVDINIGVKLTTKTIVLHASSLTIVECTLGKGKDYFTVSHSLDKSKEILVIKSPKLFFDMEYVLSIKFEGTLKDDMLGFYKTSYVDERGIKKRAAGTYFAPIYARRAFPCFDEPKYKTPFTIKLAHYPDQKVISNMPIEGTGGSESTINNRQWTTFKITPPMATYLVAFVISDFAVATSSEKFISIYARSNAIQHTSYAARQAQQLYNSMVDYTSVRYTLPKLDIVAIPDVDTVPTEGWGMTSFREQLVILDESDSAESHKSAVTEAISREISHQWFGNLVTPAWWDYVWMSEGFATYFQYFNTKNVELSWDFEQLFVIKNVQFTLWNEVHVPKAMTSSIWYRSQFGEVFDIINSQKAGSIIRMFEHVITPTGFRSALNQYLLDGYIKHKGTVEPDVLFKAFETEAANRPFHSDTSITTIMRTWTENIGYPHVSVRREKWSKKVVFEGSTYRTSRSAISAPYQHWIIPITYATKSNLDFSNTNPTLWDNGDGRQNSLYNIPNDDWVICNLNQSGYYRVNYDSYGWNLILKQLKEDHTKIPLLNRAQLLDDAFAFAMDDTIQFDTPIALTSYLEKETEITPWLTTSTIMERLYFSSQGTKYFETISKFAHKVMQKGYANLGFDITSTDRHIVKVGKPSILKVCSLVGIMRVRDDSLKEFWKNIEDITKVQPDLKEIVYCLALRDEKNPEDVYNKLWSLYHKSNIAYDSNTILSTLGCAKDEKILRKTLFKLFGTKSEELRKKDAIHILKTFFSFTESVTTAIQFFLENEEFITELNDYKFSLLEIAIPYIGSKIQTEEQMRWVEELKIKLGRRNETKYKDLVQSIQKIYHDAERRLKFIRNWVERLSAELTPPNERKSNRNSEDYIYPESPRRSNAPALVVSWLLIIPSFVTYYNLFQ